MHKKQSCNLRISILVGAVLIGLLAGACSRAPVIQADRGEAEQPTSALAIQIVRNDAEQKVDVLVDGQPFTSYLYSDQISVLKKPVIYPILTPKGNDVTRGFPLQKRAGERVDHPHQIGFWLNYGDVNGFDFWNNSDAITGERISRMGTIYHKAIRNIDEENSALEVSCEWVDAQGNVLLTEETRFVFHAGPVCRVIDRITTLTAVNGPVAFTDNKEGMVAIRVTRALEHPTKRPVRVTDSEGVVVEVPVMDNTGVTGEYLTSEGVRGAAAWGTRARWVMLTGVVNDEPVTLAILDHPKNVGYPTYWHARDYGLFSANPLGQKIFSEGKEELNFTLGDGESTTFRYRLVLNSGKTSPEDMESQYQAFIAEVQ